MGRNITFNVDDEILENARAAALEEGTTLNAQVRLWLEAYGRRRMARKAMALVGELRGKVDTGGRKFTRDELNER